MNMVSDLFEVYKNDIESDICEYITNHNNNLFKDYPIFCLEIISTDGEFILKCNFIPTKEKVMKDANVFSVNTHYHLLSLMTTDIKNYVLKWFGLDIRIDSDYFYVDSKPYYDYESTYTLGF